MDKIQICHIVALRVLVVKVWTIKVSLRRRALGTGQLSNLFTVANSHYQPI